MQFKQASYDQTTPFAEVVESSLSTAISQCWRNDDLPTFGSFVTIDSNPILIGCVTDIKHLSRDPSRIPTTYQMTDEELHREQPQIFALLITQFTIKIVGYRDNNAISFFLPPLPAGIHRFVSRLAPTDTDALFTDPQLFEALMRGDEQTNLDDLLLVIFRKLAARGPIAPSLLDHFYDLYRNYTKGDIARCRRFFARTAEPIQHQ
jgi:hypothetical protein